MAPIRPKTKQNPHWSNITLAEQTGVQNGEKVYNRSHGELMLNRGGVCSIPRG